MTFDPPLTIHRHMSCCKESFTAEYITPTDRQRAQQAVTDWAKAHLKSCPHMQKEAATDEDDGHGL